MTHDTLVVGVWCSTASFGFSLWDFTCSARLVAAVGCKGLGVFRVAGKGSLGRCLTSASHESMNSFACSHASSTVSSVDSTISDKRLKVTDSSNSQAVSSMSSHRSWRWCSRVNWQVRSRFIFAIPSGAPSANVSTRCLIRLAISKHGMTVNANAPSRSVMF